MGTGDTPKGCTDSSRWLASEASVTTGNVISQLLASRLGCKGFGADTRGCAASRLNPWLISLHPFGVISIIHTFIDRAYNRPFLTVGAVYNRAVRQATTYNQLTMH
jgi:hypothetical protein